jgi:hypothetical protein
MMLAVTGKMTITRATIVLGLMLTVMALPVPAQQDKEEGYKEPADSAGGHLS